MNKDSVKKLLNLVDVRFYLDAIFVVLLGTNNFCDDQ
jgi:hypothetical protein